MNIIRPLILAVLTAAALAPLAAGAAPGAPEAPADDHAYGEDFDEDSGQRTIRVPLPIER